MSVDPYVYPGTNVLKNKLGIQDASKLEHAERGMAADEVLDMRREGITGMFDVQHLKDVHNRIFGDVYPWAGEFRTIQIWKGGTEFTAPDKIESELGRLCERIREADYFRDMPKDDAANAFADIMADLNQIHPFREGNGRTQRAFIGQLALNAGYDLDFTKMSENDMRNASMAAGRGNRNLMRYLFRESMSDSGCGKGPVKNNAAGNDKSVERDAEPEQKHFFGFITQPKGRKMTLAELLRPKSPTAKLMEQADKESADDGKDGNGISGPGRR